MRSSGLGMSKSSPYISCFGITMGLSTPAAIGCDGFTVHTSSRSPSLRHFSEHVVPSSRGEDLREVPGVQDDQAHAAQDVPLDPLDHLVADVTVGNVPPPQKYVGRGEGLLGEPVLRVGSVAVVMPESG